MGKQNHLMKKITKKLLIVTGVIFSVSGILMSIPSGINGNNLGLILSIVSAIIGIVLIAIGFD